MRVSRWGRVNRVESPIEHRENYPKEARSSEGSRILDPEKTSAAKQCCHTVNASINKGVERTR
jgi:hypothetical protein